MTDPNDIREPRALHELTPLTLDHTPEGTLFNAPRSPDELPTVSDEDPGRILPGYIRRTPYAMEPNWGRFRYVLTHKLNTFDRDAGHCVVEGLVVVAPVYAMADHSRPDPSQTATSAVAYFAALGHLIGWVTIGHDDAGIWVAGLTTDGHPDPLAAALPGRELNADIRPDADGWPVVTGLYVPVPAAAHPMATALTKGDVIKALTTGEFAGLSDDTPLIIAKDGEGNDHSPLSGLRQAGYLPESTWSGDVTNADDGDPYAVRSIILEPVN